MHLKKIELHDFRAAKALCIELRPKVNLFVGVNGAGKSTVLQAVAISLLELMHHIQNAKTHKNSIHVSDIHNAADNASITACVHFDEYDYAWTISRSRPGVNVEYKINESDLINLSTAIKNRYKEQDSLPVIVYYPVGRVVEKTIHPMPSSDSMQHENIDVYQHALEGKPNFRNFFDWFREQDDFVNQKSLSRSSWAREKSGEVYATIARFFKAIDETIQSSPLMFPLFEKSVLSNFKFILRSPRFIFPEISDIINASKVSDGKLFFILGVIDKLDYISYKMDVLSSHGSALTVSSQENLSRVITSAYHVLNDILTNGYEDVMPILWPIYLLCFELGFWWLSAENHNKLITALGLMCLYHGGLKLEKSDESHDKFVKSINTIILSDIRKRSSAQTNFGRNIDNVIRAIQQFIPEYSNLRIDRTGRGTAKMLVDKEGREFDIGQLSDGEKNLIALIGDIARRLTIANPNSNDPLSESGIILIDELDLHLHPKWQRIVITKITEVFPNCQFIVSSHSPQVISHVQSDEVFLLKNEDGNIVNYPVNHSYGKNSDRILEDVMDETARPKNIEEKIKNIFSAIQHGNISEARDLIAELQNCIGEDGDLIRANVLIKRMEMIGK